MRSPCIALFAGLAALGCNDDGAGKLISAPGATEGLVSDGNQHAAYLLNATSTALGQKGELHVASADGKDVKVASGIFVGGYVISPGGNALFYAQINATGDDASFNYLDLTQPGALPRTLFASGMPVQPVTPDSATPTYTVPLARLGFFTPSGRYYIMGVLAPNVANSPDLHVIDVANGNDVFQRGNGAFDYLEVALPDDTMIFQDTVGGNSGPSGPPPVQTLFWVSLPAASASQPAAIDTRTAGIQVTGDNRTVVYQRVDRTLYAWDATTRPAAGTLLGANTLGFAAGGSATGPVAYVGTDRSVHVVSTDGTKLVDVDAATAAADLLSPVVISPDGADVYYFRNVEIQNARGTLIHLPVAAGATPTPIVPNVSIDDVHPVAGGLLFLMNVDATGQLGDAVRAARDGGGAIGLGTQVPVGGLAVVTPMMMPGSSTWLSPHLTAATIDKTKKLVDGADAVVGALALTTSMDGPDVTIDPSVRAGQFAVSDDLASLVYVGGSKYDTKVNNYAGDLKQVAVATPTRASASLLHGVTEVGSVVGRSLFVNAPKASSPGVYFVKF